MRPTESEPDLIAESRRLCEILQGKLPTFHFPSPIATVELTENSLVTVMIPSKFEAVVGSLAWRAHDFATLASDLLTAGRVIPGAVITRSLMETTALVYCVHKKTKRALTDLHLEELDSFLVRCMSGDRLNKGEPESPNVLTLIQSLDKEPGCDQYADF